MPVTQLERPVAEGVAAPRPRRRWPAVLPVAGAFAVGVLLTATLAGRGAPRTPVLPAVDARPDQAVVAAGEGADREVPAPADATTAEGSLAGFLAAEVSGDHAGSYPYLSAADRAEHPSVESWVRQHAYIAPVEGFRVTGSEQQDDGTTIVTTELRMTSSLDPVLGLVPARARGDWVAVPEDGRWRVAFARSALRPRYPDDAAAREAVHAWAEQRQRCRSDVAEYDGQLFGRPGLPDRLCGAGGPVEVGSVGRLGSSGQDLVTAFGPDASSWARVVPLLAPVAMDVVLAPVDDRWLVVSAIEPRP